MPKQTLVVIGGGAAGFFCAVNAARLNRNLQVILLEKSNKFLAKVKVSGGGRCNVTHNCNSMADMLKNYPRGAKFLKKAFYQFFTTDCIDWFTERNVPLKTESDGRMFPLSNTSQSIIDCLLKEAAKYNVEMHLQSAVQEIIINENAEKNFSLLLANGTALPADFICVACGGFPKADQFNWLTKMGHNIEKPVPSLFSFNIPKHPITQLMGIVVENAEVRIPAAKLQQSGPLLITHWGFSGPAILKLSSWGAVYMQQQNYELDIFVNWLPAFDELSLKEAFQKIRFEIATQKIANKNPFSLPARLWSFLIEQAGINLDIRWADLPAKQQNILIKLLCSSNFSIKGKTTFKEEFVTCGGIKLNEVSSQTMQSNLVPGLYFAGEILDVDAVTGGFNFQNAWTTGFIAATAIANSN